MKVGLYAGSFDPWSVGHQYVLERALDVFDIMHVVIAINPSKKSSIDADTRSRLIANAIDPFCNWWELKPQFNIQKKIIINTHSGLIADYAKAHNIQHLIRGLRSTTDFEAEFNLYFANQAIDPSLQTWAVMCPPMLLHCSSTYIKAVLGRPGHKFVGTSFTAQTFMLNQPQLVGQLFDLIAASGKLKMSKSEYEAFHTDLQVRFSHLVQKQLAVEDVLNMKVQETLKNSLSKEKNLQFYQNLLQELIGEF